MLEVGLGGGSWAERGAHGSRFDVVSVAPPRASAGEGVVCTSLIAASNY